MAATVVATAVVAAAVDAAAVGLQWLLPLLLLLLVLEMLGAAVWVHQDPQGTPVAQVIITWDRRKGNEMVATLRQPRGTLEQFVVVWIGSGLGKEQLDIVTIALLIWLKYNEF